jgi:hypothetical protein
MDAPSHRSLHNGAFLQRRFGQADAFKVNGRTIGRSELESVGSEVAAGEPANTPTNWLDAHCWGCGTENVAPHPDGPLLCRDCLAELLTDAPVDPLQLGRRARWETHALEQCWRCMVAAVDRKDVLGLCPPCCEQLEGSER